MYVCFNRNPWRISVTAFHPGLILIGLLLLAHWRFALILWTHSFIICIPNHKLLNLWTNVQSYLTHPFSTQQLYYNEKANNRNWCSFSNSFMSNKKLEQLLLLSSQNTFPNMYKTLQLETTDLWMPFQRSSQCEQDIPSSVAKKISLFQQVRTLGANQTGK